MNSKWLYQSPNGFSDWLILWPMITITQPCLWACLACGSQDAEHCRKDLTLHWRAQVGLLVTEGFGYTARLLKVPWIGRRPDFGSHYIYLLKLELFCCFYLQFYRFKGIEKVVNVNCLPGSWPISLCPDFVPQESGICSASISPASLAFLDWTLTPILDFIGFLDAEGEGKL